MFLWDSIVGGGVGVRVCVRDSCSHWWRMHASALTGEAWARLWECGAAEREREREEDLRLVT